MADSASYLWGNLEGELVRVWAPMGPGVKLYGKSSEKKQLSNPDLSKSFSLAGLALVNRGFGVGAALQEGWPGLEKKGFNLKKGAPLRTKRRGGNPEREKLKQTSIKTQTATVNNAFTGWTGKVPQPWLASRIFTHSTPQMGPSFSPTGL